jgi:hypothetical protein
MRLPVGQAHFLVAGGQTKLWFTLRGMMAMFARIRSPFGKWTWTPSKEWLKNIKEKEYETTTARWSRRDL